MEYVYKVHIKPHLIGDVKYIVIERFDKSMFDKKDFRLGRIDEGKYSFFNRSNEYLWVDKLKEVISDFDIIENRNEIINEINNESKN